MILKLRDWYHNHDNVKRVSQMSGFCLPVELAQERAFTYGAAPSSYKYAPAPSLQVATRRFSVNLFLENLIYFLKIKFISVLLSPVVSAVRGTNHVREVQQPLGTVNVLVKIPIGV